MDDIKLIKRCQNGDKEAFQELVKMYHPYVYRFLIRTTGDEQLSQDLTQDTFIKIIRSIEKFDIYGKAKFSTYIITVSKNCYIDYLRKQKNFMSSIPVEEINNLETIGMEEAVLDRVFSEDIIEKLEGLSDEQKIVIKMKYMEGLTLREIGSRLNLEPKTIKSRIHNGIVKLRKMFEGSE
jgi:RNA polymerase sigma-70 factor, ECF subfamily